MAEMEKGLGVKPDLVEELVKKHFGPTFTSRLAYNFVRSRYVPSDLPRRLAAPQTVFGVTIGWKAIGEFTDNLGFRLELWEPAFKPQAEALVAEYNQRTEGTKLELYPCVMSWPATAGRAA